MTIAQVIKQNKKRTEDCQKKNREDAGAVFGELCQKLFKKHPEMTFFGWDQYTPYFNDGNELEFEARIDYPHINGFDSDNICKAWSTYPAENLELLKAKESVIKFLKELNKDSFFEELFGDHVSISVSPEGVTITACDHE